MADDRVRESINKPAKKVDKKVSEKGSAKSFGLVGILARPISWPAAALVYVLVGFALYARVLHGPFIFDDKQSIPDNKFIRISTITLGALEDAGFKSLCDNRPVANISFALNYYFGGYNVAGYHAVNILIHVLTAIFLFLLIKATLDLCCRQSGRPESNAYPSSMLAFLAALIWFVHPMQTQAVSYIVQRMASMAGMFYVLSLLLYVHGRLDRGYARWALYSGSVLSGVLAVGSKEIAITLPVFVLLYEWYFFQDLSFKWLKKAVLPLIGVAAVLAAVGYFYLGVHPVDILISQYSIRDFTPGQRVMTELRVVVLYLTLLILPLPSRLNLDYDFPVSRSLVDPFTTLLSLGLLVALAALAIYLAKRQRLISFAIVWFLGNLVIESSVVALELVYEHRLYIPSMFVTAAAVAAASQYARDKRVLVGLLCIVACIFSIWSFQRNAVWADELTLWQDCVKKSPDKARPRNNLGDVLLRLGMTDEAIRNFSKAVELDPNYVDALNNLGNALYSRGYYNESIRYLSRALDLDPKCVSAKNNMANSLAASGRIDEAIKYYGEALKLAPETADVHNGLGVALVVKGDIDGAVTHFREALRLAPDNVGVRMNLERARAIKKAQ